MTRAGSVAAVVGAVLVFGGGWISSAAAAPPDACAVLTAAQVSDALGVTVADGTHLATSVCQWAPAGSSAAQSKKVMVTIQDKRAFDYAKMPVPDANITKTPVTGIGDDAVLGTTKGVKTALTVLTVKKGDVVFAVRVYGFPDDQTQAKEKALALLILQKI